MLRLATADDANAIAATLVAFNVEFQTPTPPAIVLAERLVPLLSSGALMAAVDESDGRDIDALALLCPRPSVWYPGPIAVLDELYVVPSLRGQGIGTRLLRFAEDLLIELGYRAVEINVDGEDVDARRFYERHGYRNQEPGQDEQIFYYYRELDG